MLDDNIENLETEETTENLNSESDINSEESNEDSNDQTKEVNDADTDLDLEKTKVAKTEETVKEEHVVKEDKGEQVAAKEKKESKVAKTEETVKEEHVVKEDKGEQIVAKENKEIVEEKVYDGLGLEQLVTEFKKLLQEESIPFIKNNVEKIKQSFNKKFRALVEEKKEIFVKEGGNVIDFHFTDPIKSAFNDLVFEFKTRRERFYKQIEQEQKENLTQRLAVIEELKQLIDNAEASTMYNQFQELQKKWRAIGKIPRTKYNDTWRTYHHHVERFYDLLHLNKDFRDLDFKHNHEEKLKLVEKAEKLAEDSDLNHAFKELQILHRMWKEEVGPVARDLREEIWQRFSNATKIIHDKRHEFQKELEVKYEENVAKKREVIAKISKLYSKEINSHSIWQQKIKELNALRDEFFNLGRVPKKVSNQIWNEFKEVTRVFNKAKNNFYKHVKKDQHTNLEKKKALVEKAKSFKDSEDFDTVTELMKQIQNEWKTIGHVPRKFSDKIWKEFKDACNHYFDRLHGNQDEENKEQLEVFNKKKALLESIKSQADTDGNLTLDLINSYIDDWHALGRLHRNMRHVDTKFNKLVNSLYAKLNLDEKEVSMLRFKNTISNFVEAKEFRKLDNEQLFIRKKIDELSKEIQQLENNISFISNASDDNPLLKNVRDNIENYIAQRALWKEKLTYLTSVDY